MKELLPLLPRPSRYLGNEWGAARKDPALVRARVALAFPDLYDVGMSYLGQRILAQAVNARPHLAAERVYAPAQDAAEILRAHNTPLATLEGDIPLSQVDVVAFSLTHELCYTNVLYMLDLSGIPLRAADRADRAQGTWPLILAGGGACFNAEPLAPFVDAMVLGDGEEALPAILEAVADARDGGLSRAELLRRLITIPGVYVPEFFQPRSDGSLEPLIPGYERVEKAILPDLAGAPFPELHPVSSGQAVHDRYTLELARGCTRGCRFCHAGMVYRPVREKTPAELGETLSRAIAATGYEEVSFLSLSTGDYSALEGLFDTAFDRCAAEQVSISLPSLRVGSLSENIMRRIASIRRTGVTLAPEAGSQRLRDVINKGVTEDALIEHVRALFERGWQQVKLYFMIGLPTETDADLDAIVDLCLKVRDAAGRHVKRLQVTAAVSPFVPKTHTPFQWEPQISMEEIRRRVYYLKDAMRPYKRITLKWHQPEMSWLEGVVSRGDRRLAGVIERAYRKGALFSSWKDHLDLFPYQEALSEEGLDPAAYQGGRDLDVPLPWEHLDCGVSREFLLTERRRALEEKLTEDCRFGACRNCGVCNHGGRVSRLALQSQQHGPDSIRPRVVHARRDQEDLAPAPAPLEAPEQAPAESQEIPATPAKPADLGLSDRQAQYRIWYEKLAEAAYLSQLEVQSILERALRRTKFPLSFSAGFHPMPRVSFGRALPVGVESNAEWFTLTLREALDPELVLSTLAAQMPRGLRPFRIDPMGVIERSGQAAREHYTLTYTGEPADLARWQAQWQALLATDTFMIERQSKKGPKPTDLRPLVAEARPLSEASVALTLDWTGDYMSPVNLVRAVNEPISPLSFHLLKTGQEFPG